MIALLRGLFLLGFWFTLIGLIAPFMIGGALITGNENMIYRPAKFLIRLGLRLVGVRVEVTGLDRLKPGQAYIFTPNHQSFIEVPMLVGYLDRNPAYLAKKEVFKYPIFGIGIKAMGCVPVDRRNTQSAIESAKLATEYLKQGKSYVVYPEGTRSPDGRLLPFKKGAFVMAMEAGVPIVPISISGAVRVMPRSGISVRPETIRVTVHEPINTQGRPKDKISELIELTREKIVSALDPEEISTNKFSGETENQFSA
jgi:1-acyl-sn-glycerol-3-phosphate acyltransferase